MPRCAGSKPDGTPCERIVGASQTHCYSHDPQRRAERQRNAARAGRGSGFKELRNVKAELRALIEDVRDGTLPTGRAAVMLQGYNCLLRAAEQERKHKEVEEFEVRLAALERSYGVAG